MTIRALSLTLCAMFETATLKLERTPFLRLTDVLTNNNDYYIGSKTS